MKGGENTNAAEQKAGELRISLYGESPERPPVDAPDGQSINKLAAIVGSAPP